MSHLSSDGTKHPGRRRVECGCQSCRSDFGPADRGQSAEQWEAVGRLVRTKREANGNGGFLVVEVLLSEISHERARLISTAPDGYALAKAVVLRGHTDGCDYGAKKVCTCLVKPAAELLLKARGK